MKTSNAIKSLLLVLFAWSMALAMSSCIYDDLSKCGLTVRFAHTYNMKEADAFAEEADWVKLWVFDAQQKLVTVIEQSGGFGNGAVDMPVSQLPAGDYTFVAWAGSSASANARADASGVNQKRANLEHADFDFPTLKVGDDIEMLTARLQRDAQGVNASKIHALLNGVVKASITGVKQQVVLDMKKCTNTLRVVLMPTSSQEKLKVDDFEFYIEGKNGWLAYDAEPYQKDELVYRPYYQELSEDKAEGPQGEAVVDQAIVAQLNTSRIMANSNPRLVIRNRQSQREVLNINLAWFLSLQAIGEHRAEWSDQEYLDRQDEFAITFFTNGSTWMQTHIIVNGWVLSLQDIEL